MRHADSIVRPRRARRFAGRFEIVRRLPGDGFTTDRLAVDARTGAVVRLEVLSVPEGVRQPALRDAFLAACAAAGAARAPGLVVPLARGAGDEGTLFAASLAQEGPTLAERPPRNPEEALAVLHHVAALLAVVHDAGAVHGTLRSHTVLRRGTQVLLRSFGWGDQLAPVHGARPGAVPGPFAGLAPEQAQGEAPDPRTDVYAFGALAHRLLARRDPFVALDARALAVAHLFDVAPALVGIDARTADVVCRCLEKDPDARFADGAALLAALTGEGRVPAQRPASPPAPQRPAAEGPEAQQAAASLPPEPALGGIWGEAGAVGPDDLDDDDFDLRPGRRKGLRVLVLPMALLLGTGVALGWVWVAPEILPPELRAVLPLPAPDEPDDDREAGGAARSATSVAERPTEAGAPAAAPAVKPSPAAPGAPPASAPPPSPPKPGGRTPTAR